MENAVSRVEKGRAAEEETVAGAVWKEDVWETKTAETAEENVARLMRRMRSGTAVEKTAAGDLAEALLVRVSGVLAREGGRNGGSSERMSGEMRLGAAAGSFRQENAVEQLYSRVNTAWLRESTPGEHGIMVNLSGETQDGGLSLREIDRAFQRDARRYDGGLSLL